jgi:hypothetical protein
MPHYCADQESPGVSEETLKVLDSQVLWQVRYEQGGVQYWWDYDETISFGLENAWRNGELFGFEWDWKEHKNGEISEYLADPEHGLVVNENTKWERKIRRIVLARCQ